MRTPGTPGYDMPLVRASEDAMRRRVAQRRWRAAIAVLAVVVVVLAAVTVAESLRTKGGSPPSSSTGQAGGSGRGHTTTTTTGTPGGPTITALSPSSGGTGQVVVVSGTGLFSPDGNVQVRFGSVAAPTTCSSETSCKTMVPSGLAPGPITVTVSTASGQSNGVPFTYT